MMRLPPFRHHVARSLDDAAAALADGGPNARLIAGGTDLLPNMKRRQEEPELLVSVARLAELRGIRGGSETEIGALTSITDIARSEAIRAAHPALSAAARQIASPLIRNTATLGGNLCLDTRCNYFDQSEEWRSAIGYCLRREGSICWVAPSSTRCWAVASGDAAPALIALGARVTLRSRDDERDVALEDLYADDGAHPLTKRADEILTAVRIPARETRSTYWKLRRRGSIDFPLLGVAAALRLSPSGVIEHARLVLGAVASRPLLVAEASQLVGKRLTDDVIEELAEAAARQAKPLDNTDMQMTWRKTVARSFVSGVLRQLRGDDVSAFPLLAREAAAAAGV